jgi:hypothetical protein
MIRLITSQKKKERNSDSFFLKSTLAVHDIVVMSITGNPWRCRQYMPCGK